VPVDFGGVEKVRVNISVVFPFADVFFTDIIT
jgi:hypothetical protein